MKAIEIAKKYKLHETQISHIRNHGRYTDDLSLAQEIAKITGKKPIIYVKKNIRKIALAAYPYLGEAIKKSI
jgi:hypothetical protein